jgi:CheY-like chemotaxis protein
MGKPKPVMRVLMVEDNEIRAQRLQSWLPEDVRTVVASSVGRALGVLQRDRGDVYAGILLDHDLGQQAAVSSDRYMTGMDVVDAIIMNIAKHVPILVHSMNLTWAPVMVSRLTSAGFWVTRVQMDNLTEEWLHEWMEDVREIWKDMQDE